MKDQVRRMAENDEPKCGNCSWWQRGGEGKAIGLCALNKLSAASEERHFHETTDLSLCSAWEPKE